MKMRHHEVGVVVLEVRCSNREHQPGKTTDGEQHDEAYRKQHRRLKGHRAAPHGADPVEHFDARRNRDQHGGVHEKQFAFERHAGGKHVVRPNDK